MAFPVECFPSLNAQQESVGPTLPRIKGALEVVRSSNDPLFRREILCVPITRTIFDDDLNPISAFLKLRRGPYSFLLESVDGNSATNLNFKYQNRYSFMGTEPYKVMKSFPTDTNDPLIPVEEQLSKITFVEVDSQGGVIGRPARLTAEQNQNDSEGWCSVYHSFGGGAVGYVGYDAVRHFERRVVAPAKDPLQLPETLFMLFNSYAVFDNVARKLHLVALCKIDLANEQQLENNYNTAISRLQQLYDRVTHRTPYPFSSGPTASKEHKMTSNFAKQGYIEVVQKMQEHITKGDIIQVVPSQRITLETPVHPFNVYRHLRSVNPSPYMFYFDLEDFQVVGASPECLVSVTDAGVIATHPIAGTRPRGPTIHQDKLLANELINDPKERAEHIMLVDLGRNDMNRAADPSTVKVTSLMQVERYSHVMHIVSKVEGLLREGKSPFDAFRSIFPAGTVSGAPKVMAMELIGKHEPERRGLYSGAAGYFSFTGPVQTCIALRTLVFKSNKAYLQAGGGVVFDSIPESEYEETVNKMMGSYKAIQVTMQSEKVVEPDPDFDKKEHESDAIPYYSIQLPRKSAQNTVSLWNTQSATPSSSSPATNPVVSASAALGTFTRTSFDADQPGPKVLLIDNYDSFTYNLYQYLCLLGAQVVVFRNDCVTLEQCQQLGATHIVISPGPGHPSSAGVSNPVIKYFAGKIPVLGVCLGHQAMVEAFGGVVKGCGEIKHGKTSDMIHDGKGVFKHIPSPFQAIRYHSLAAEKETFPHRELVVTATSESGIIMGARHRTLNIEGVQFHPESIKTEHGMTMMSNFLQSKGGSAQPEAAAIPSPSPSATVHHPNHGDVMKCVHKLLTHNASDVTEDEIGSAMKEIMNGHAVPAQIASLITALSIKGPTVALLSGLADVMLQFAEPCELQGLGDGPLMDIVGTGGDGRDTFNVSSAACFVVAACGAKIAKHGNRSSSGATGSADFLQALGAKLELSSHQIRKTMQECGFAFLFAAHFHPAMKHVAHVRSSLPGVRSIFNLLGPVTNPVRPPYQVIGIGSASLASLYAELLAARQRAMRNENSNLETRAIVVHSNDGLDEVSVSADTEIWEIVNGSVVNHRVVNPVSDFGVKNHPLEDISGGTAHERAEVFKAIANGAPLPVDEKQRKRVLAIKDFLLINSAVALHSAGMAEDFKEGVLKANQAIDSGKVAALLKSFVALTNQTTSLP